MEEGSQIERGTVFPGTHATVRLTQKAFVTSGSRVKRVFDLGDVKVEKDIVTFMKRRMKTLSWRKDRLTRHGVAQGHMPP